MLSTTDYIGQSLGLHLFFARIMKEHAFFLEIGFTPKNGNFTDNADEFRMAFDDFLKDVIALSDAVIGAEYLESGEMITPFTLKAEKASAFYTGVDINTQLTELEENLSAGGPAADYNNGLVQRVYMLNSLAMDLLEKFIQFKARILQAVTNCQIFTMNYPLLLDHVLREAKYYYKEVQQLQDQRGPDPVHGAYEKEPFWNRNLAEHALFTRGLLDPSENKLIIAANDLANVLNNLYQESLTSRDYAEVTGESLGAATEMSNFDADGVQGLLDCKVKSIIIPLVADHDLREANHYIRLLKSYEQVKQ